MSTLPVRLIIPPQEISEHSTAGLQRANPLTHAVAQPLYAIGIIQAIIAQRIDFGADKAPPRRRPSHTITLVLQGELEVVIGRRREVLGPGMICCCPADQLHARRSLRRALWMIYFEVEPDPRWEPLAESGGYVRAYESTDHMYLLLSRIVEAHRHGDVSARLAALEDARALAELLRRELRRLRRKPHKYAGDLRRIVAEIRQAPEREWSIGDIANRLRLSPRSLNRLCQHEYGISPMELVIQQRLSRAAELLLEEDYTIEAVARELGYRSPYSFSNLFARHMGIRPGQFRKLATGAVSGVE